MRNNQRAVFLLALLELLFVAPGYNAWESPGSWARTAFRVSAGFPAPCLSYTAVRVTGDLPPWQNFPEREQWLPGLRFSILWCIIDFVAAMAALIGFRRLLRSETGRVANAGFVLGCVAGASGNPTLLTFLCLRHPAIGWIVSPLVMIAVSATACFFTRKMSSVWPLLLMLAVASFVMPWAARWADSIEENHGFGIHSISLWSPSLVEEVGAPLAVCVVFSILALCMRRLCPAFRRYQTAA